MPADHPEAKRERAIRSAAETIYLHIFTHNVGDGMFMENQDAARQAREWDLAEKAARALFDAGQIAAIQGDRNEG